MRKLLLASSALVFAGSAVAADLARPPADQGAAGRCGHSLHLDRLLRGRPCRRRLGSHHFHRSGQRRPLHRWRGSRLAPAGASIGVNSQAACWAAFRPAVTTSSRAIGWSESAAISPGPTFTASPTIPSSSARTALPFRSARAPTALASVTGRVGYAWDRFLVYGKGGGAWAHDKYSISNLNCAFFTTCNLTGSTDRVGWTAGVGVEWAFAPNWSALVEYNHYGFGNKSISFTDPAVPVTQQYQRQAGYRRGQGRYQLSLRRPGRGRRALLTRCERSGPNLPGRGRVCAGRSADSRCRMRRPIGVVRKLW